MLEVRNDGAAKSSSAPIAHYLSDDATLDSGDLLIGLRRGTGAVAPGKTRQVKISLVRPGAAH
ncbi:MAG: hypothetical protein ACHQ6T_12340 [Myxococcota bacterium]